MKFESRVRFIKMNAFFLKKAKSFGAQIENGKMMFIYQAQKAFLIWHNILPAVDEETVNLFDT